MKSRFLLGPLFIALLLWTAAGDAPPRLGVTVNQRQWRVNESGVLRIQLVMRDGKLRPGARISVGLPGSWAMHAFRLYEDSGVVKGNQPYPVFTSDLAGYLSVDDSSAGRWDQSIIEESADGTYHRFARTLVLKLREGELGVGDRLAVHYGSGARPLHASFLAETVRFPIRVDAGDGVWHELPASPALETSAGPAEKLLVTAPSQAV
ncbi:MAG: hypothetical protein GY953_42845, partial [bacterium]|nr:hypothetical protein [bacterium]